MAFGKKGQLRQFMTTLVDSTDFASIESGITESDFNSGATVKFYGCDNGVSTAYTSGTVSKAGRLVRSGIFQIVLKGSENNYDNMLVRIEKTGCATQTVTWENVDNDDSDIMSALTVIQSMASDAASAAQQGSSRALINQSRISDVASYLVAMSDSLSDMHSDLQSYLVGMSGMLSDVQSAVAATELDASDLSDIASAVWARAGADPTTVPAVNASMGAKVDWLTALSRNKLTQTAAVQSLRNDADSADIASAAVSDDLTTYTREEWS